VPDGASAKHNSQFTIPFHVWHYIMPLSIFNTGLTFYSLWAYCLAKKGR
jgi:hypothetical protein